MANAEQRAMRVAIFIGALAVGVRLIAITQPFVDNWSWRETDVAAIARNYLENGFHFAYPQIDWAGDAPGYVGTEFPLLSFAAALIYKVAGLHDWIGRGENVLVFAVTLPFFYLLVRQIFDRVTSVWSLFFYSFAPLNVVASREFMPDAPSLGLSIAGLYFFLRWLEEQDWKPLFAASFTIAAALLIKLPSIVIGVPLLYLTVTAVRHRRTLSDRLSDGQRPSLPRGEFGGTGSVPPGRGRHGGCHSIKANVWKECFQPIFSEPQLWLFVAVVLLPAVFWYWHALEIAKQYYPHHFFGSGAFQIQGFAWYWKIARATATSSLTPILAVVALAGGFVIPERKYSHLFHWWLAVMIVFIYLAGWGNRHQWYQLPLVPIAAVFAGNACRWIADVLRAHWQLRITFSILMLFAFGTESYSATRRFYQPHAAALRDLGLKLQEITPRGALIAAAADGDPTVFYYAHRKGWHLPENGVHQGNPLDSAQIIANLEKLKTRGASYLVLYSGTFWWLEYYKEFAEHLTRTSTPIARTAEYAIYKLRRVGE